MSDCGIVLSEGKRDLLGFNKGRIKHGTNEQIIKTHQVLGVVRLLIILKNLKRL